MKLDITFAVTGRTISGKRISGTIVARCDIDPTTLPWPSQHWEGYRGYCLDLANPDVQVTQVLGVKLA